MRVFHRLPIRSKRPLVVISLVAALSIGLALMTQAATHQRASGQVYPVIILVQPAPSATPTTAPSPTTSTTSSFVPIVTASGSSGSVSVTVVLSDGTTHTISVDTTGLGTVTVSVDAHGHVRISSSGGARKNATITVSPPVTGAPPNGGSVSTMTVGLDASGNADIQF